jgi:uncharacterized RDD family membrane protein YckC
MKRASLTARFFAFVIDVAFLWCVSALLTSAAILGRLAGADPVSPAKPVAAALEILLVFFLSNMLLSLFYFTCLTAHGETTLGKAAFGLKVVNHEDGTDIGWGRAFGRACAYALSAFPFLLGFFMAFLLRGRAVHDVLAGTRVVREE